MIRNNRKIETRDSTAAPDRPNSKFARLAAVAVLVIALGACDADVDKDLATNGPTGNLSSEGGGKNPLPQNVRERIQAKRKAFRDAERAGNRALAEQMLPDLLEQGYLHESHAAQYYDRIGDPIKAQYYWKETLFPTPEDPRIETSNSYEWDVHSLLHFVALSKQVGKPQDAEPAMGRVRTLLENSAGMTAGTGYPSLYIHDLSTDERVIAAAKAYAAIGSFGLRPDAAVESLQKAAQLFSDNAVVHFYYAMGLSEIKKWDLASDALDRAVALDHDGVIDDELMRRYRQRIDSAIEFRANNSSP